MKKKVPCRVIETSSSEHAGKMNCRDNFDVADIIKMIAEALYWDSGNPTDNQPVTYFKRVDRPEKLDESDRRGSFLDFYI